MSINIKMILEPDINQCKMLWDTMNRYNEMCNYISLVVHEHESMKLRFLYYWEVENTNHKLYEVIRENFRDINSNYISLALNKVAKLYRKTRSKDAHKFAETFDCSSYLISIKHTLPQPSNIGMLTISTLLGRQTMHFTFDNTQRNELNIILNSKKYREYEISYQADKYYLNTIIKDEPDSLPTHKLTPNNRNINDYDNTF